MAQPDLLRTRSNPIALYCIAAILWLVTIALGIKQANEPPFKPKLINWYTLNEAPDIARKSGKPILYFFCAEWCGPCKQMETFALTRKDVADIIKKRYVPVLVIDEKREKGKNPPQIKKLEKRLSINSFPTVISVHPELIDAKLPDVLSTGNRIERTFAQDPSWASEYGSDEAESWDYWFEQSTGHIPAQSGFNGNDEMREFLSSAYLWRRRPPDRGDIHWQPISTINKTTKLPKLIAIIDQYGRYSDRMRLRLFDDAVASKFINDHFVPFLVEIKKNKSSAADVGALKKRYGIKKAPAIIVDDGKHDPQISDDFRNKRLTLQFLCRYSGIDIDKVDKEDKEEMKRSGRDDDDDDTDTDSDKEKGENKDDDKDE